jgi:hypothetical protein
VSRQVADVDVDHLVNEHGIDRKAVDVRPTNSRAAKRNLALIFEMKHAADHAQRKVGHEHG